MQSQDSPFFIFDTHTQAEEAIQSLNRYGFDVKKLSLIGKGYHTEEHPIGFYTAGDRIRSWGRPVPSGAASGACCWHRRRSSFPAWA